MLTPSSSVSSRASPQGEHPSRQDIADLLQGRQSGTTDVSWVEQHLEDCLYCQQLATGVEEGALEALVRVASRRLSAAPLRVSEGYELIEEVGRGASSIVYRAFRRGMRRPVAFKVLLSGSAAQPQELARFRRESEALARLNHPNIVRIYDVGEQDGVPFLAMEWIEGEPLDKFLRANPLPPHSIARLLASLADGMQHAHENGILHRDLKPQNVLVSHGEVKIVDFGLARFRDGDGQQTRTGVMLGTPSYAAPEQVRGQSDALGPTTDVYGLGAILYEALVGRPPFHGGTAMETLQWVLDREPVSVNALRPSIPRDLGVICHRCLSKSPAARFRSAAALADDLRRFLAGKPILSRATSKWERALRWSRRNPWPLAFLVLFTALWMSVLAVQAWYQVYLNAQRERAVNNYQSARASIWKMLDAVQQESGFDIPRLNELRELQTVEALQLFEALAKDEGTRESQLDYAQIRLRFGSMLLGGGEFDRGLEVLRQARSGFAAVLQSVPDDADARAGIVGAQVKIAAGLQLQGRYAAAIPIFESVLPDAKKLSDQFPNNPTYLSHVAWIHHNWGNALASLQQYESGLQHYQTAVEIGHKVCGKLPSSADARRKLAESQTCIGLCQMALDDPSADASYLQAIVTLRSILQEAPRDLNAMYAIATTQLNRSNILASRGEVPQAIEACSDGIEALTRALQAAPEVVVYRDTLAMLFGNRALFRMNDSIDNGLELALEDWRQAIQQSTQTDVRNQCETMLVRNLSMLSQVDEGKRVLHSMQPATLTDDNLFRWVSAWGMIGNDCRSPAADQVNRDSWLECNNAIRRGFEEMKSRGMLKDPEVVSALRTGDDFHAFRDSLSPKELSELID